MRARRIQGLLNTVPPHRRCYVIAHCEGRKGKFSIGATVKEMLVVSRIRRLFDPEERAYVEEILRGKSEYDYDVHKRHRK